MAKVSWSLILPIALTAAQIVDSLTDGDPTPEDIANAITQINALVLDNVDLGEDEALVRVVVQDSALLVQHILEVQRNRGKK